MSKELKPVSCPACRAGEGTRFFCLHDAPVTCTSIFPTAAEARAVPVGEVALNICNHCEFVFNAAFDPAIAEVGARYESSQAGSPHFSAFARSLAEDWVGRYELRGRTVIEVGCGDGEFLRQMLDCGVHKGIGIDPLASTDAAARRPAGSLVMMAERFHISHAELEVDALVCRHTLEHIADVAGFLRAVHEWASRRAERVVLFEVPAAERIFAECAFWDVYYEHCCYFTSETLARAFAAAGFDVRRTARVYDGQYLLLEAKAHTGGRPLSTPPMDTNAAALCSAFGERATRAIAQARRAVEKIRSMASPVVLWQGAAKTVGYLTALNSPGLVDCAVDVSPGRQNMFLPGSGLPVYAPEALRRLKPRFVVLMNRVYFDEVAALLGAMDVGSRLLTADDLLDPACDLGSVGP